jgi:hypothetical protein
MGGLAARAKALLRRSNNVIEPKKLSAIKRVDLMTANPNFAQ